MLPRKPPRGQSSKRAKGKGKNTPKAKSNRQYIFLNGRRMASVVGDELRQSRDGSVHFLRSPRPAIAFDSSVLRKAQGAGAVRVCVTDRETGRNYRTTIQAIQEHGFPVYLGAGTQVALPIAAWSVSERKTKAAGQTPGAPQSESGAHGSAHGQTPENGAETVKASQPGLFGEVTR